MDGVPGNPNDPRGTQIRLDKGDGTLAVVEFGYMPQGEEETESVSKTAIGGWRYSSRIATDIQGNPLQGVDQGLYVLAERTLYAESGHSGQGLAGFARIGVVNKDAYQADWSGSMGLNYQGLFEGRDEDAFGIAVSTSHASDKYRILNGSKSFETVIELTYRAQLLPWLSMQPVVQRIFNPNMDAAVPDALVAGVRLEVAL